ncbi:hypothetical protein QET93_007640 [Akkermansia sp. N21116]|uniref:hypothetical protein n=1 Tax=Akkermansia sp. N21116 TaxID=3040764 RepID=UPI00244ED5A6|nr:hypothetical protein [Akkermansia sp. N21116]WPX39407.1 hypothetical protein QET93_007640 [Akkermansia sp. N21116]
MNEENKNQYNPGDLFINGLSEISDGKLMIQVDEKFAAVVSAVMKTGNRGSLQITLAFKRKGGERQIEITPKIKASIPDADIPSRILFADMDSGTLHVSDPLQTTMKFDPDLPMKVLPNRPAGSVIDVEGMPSKVANLA